MFASTMAGAMLAGVPLNVFLYVTVVGEKLSRTADEIVSSQGSKINLPALIVGIPKMRLDDTLLPSATFNVVSAPVDVTYGVKYSMTAVSDVVVSCFSWLYSTTGEQFAGVCNAFD